MSESVVAAPRRPTRRSSSGVFTRFPLCPSAKPRVPFVLNDGCAFSQFVDLVVVGGGIVGAATAFHASRAGLRPLVLERRPALSTLTTAAAAGGYRLQVESREELELIGESVELFLHFEDATGQREHDAGLRQHGYLWVTTSDEGVELQRRLEEAQGSWGLTDDQLSPDADLREAFRSLDPETRQ